MRLILLFSCVGLVMSYWGASLSLDIPLSPLLRLLGGFLVAYAVFLFLLPKFKVTASTPTALFGGALSGFCAGVFGIGGPLRALFLNAFNLPKVVYIATAGAIGIIVDSTRIITYALEGVSLPDRLWWSLVILIPASFVGAELAKHLVEKIPQHAFRLIIVTFLGLIGVKLLFFPG